MSPQKGGSPEPEGDSPDILMAAVDALLSEQMETAVACMNTNRLQLRKDAALGQTLVRFKKQTANHTVFDARAKLAGTSIGMEYDLTHLQQEQKHAAWAAFRAFRSQGVRTHCRAEKLFVMRESTLLNTKCRASRKQGLSKGPILCSGEC